MKEKIVVTYKHTYGHHYFHPANEAGKKLLIFCDPRRIRKVFTEEQIKLGRELGFDFEIKESTHTYEAADE